MLDKADNRRRYAKKEARKARGRAPSEHHEQVTFVGLARTLYPRLTIAAVPNGGYRRAKEGARLKAEGVLPGFPDVIVMQARGRYHALLVEMKRREGGVVSSTQSKLHSKLRLQGYKVEVAEGADAALKALDAYMALPRPASSPLD